MPKGNPVIEIYKGVSIRKTNIVQLVFQQTHFKRLIDESEKSGLSLHKVLAYSGQPCDRCKGTNYTVYDHDGNPIHIKKGILHIPESNGISIIEKANRKINGKRNGNSPEDK